MDAIEQSGGSEQTLTETSRPGDLVAGSRIGGYELQSVLGEGGMGVVWSARDPRLGRTLAIKLLKRADAPPDLRTRLLREGRAMARLRHPNVVTVYEMGTDGDRAFIAMELVDGGSLDGWLARHPPSDEVIAALLAAGRGLVAAHAAGLVHRDFKPSNILRGTDGRVLLADFGLARGLGGDAAAMSPAPLAAARIAWEAPGAGSQRLDSVLDSSLTRSGALIGTPPFMAPELHVGATPDPRTDQFAFCVTAWKALTGMFPYRGRTIVELLEAMSAGRVAAAPELAEPLRAALARGLEVDPEKRWPDLESLLAAIDDAPRVRERRGPRGPGGDGSGRARIRDALTRYLGVVLASGLSDSVGPGELTVNPRTPIDALLGVGYRM
jgi:serine/threonine protein kinase